MVVRQLQYAGRGYDALAAHDHGAVVQGGVGLKDVLDQRRGDLAVDDGAGIDDIRQPCVPFKDDQRADALPGHVVERPDDFLHQVVHIAQALLARGGETCAATSWSAPTAQGRGAALAGT